MLTKLSLKEKAVVLRKEGKTYGEILAIVPVAKSTLSLWLRSVSLAQEQKQRLTAKRHEAQKRGARARIRERLSSTRDIVAAAKKDIGVLTSRERLLIGAALYWAEGSKQRASSISVGIVFGNSDADMMRFFYQFLIESLNIDLTDISFTLYVHDNHRHRIPVIQRYWRKKLHLPNLVFTGIYYKRHNPLTKRTNSKEEYYGLVRLRVRRSTALQRKISGWIYGINDATWRIV